MKHNYNAWRYLDPTPADVKGGGAIIEAIQNNHKATTEQIEGIKSAHQKALDDLKADNETRLTEAKSLAQKTADELKEIKSNIATGNIGGGGIQVKHLGGELVKGLKANEGALKTGNKFSIELPSKAYSPNLGDIEQKAVGNMASSTSLTGSYFVTPTVVPGVILQAYNQTHLRDVLTLGTTDSNVVRYVRDGGGQGGPAMTAEGATKPQMDRALSIVDANVRKLATYLRVPEEMITDIPFLTSFLSNIGTQEVLAVEDTQILYGDGTGQNLSGLSANATAFSADAGGGAASGVVTAPNQYDALLASAKQMRVAKRNPSVHLVSPQDYFLMISKKDTTNNYILQGGGNGLVPVTAGGVPIMQMNQIAGGDFFTIDSTAAQIFFRENVNIRFYEQDQDNAIKNMVTIVIEERLTLAIYFTNGIIKGTFTAAITDLTS